MKKLTNLGKILSVQQQKKIVGGYSCNDDWCGALCCDGHDYQVSGPDACNVAANLCGGCVTSYRCLS